MSVSFGIHLGNSSVCIAMEKEAKCTVLANDAGERVTPAVLISQRGEWIVGKTASKSFITNNKRNMKSVDEELRTNPTSELEDGVLKYKIMDGDLEEIIPIDHVCVKFLYHMAKIARQASNGESVVNVVLAVPLDWDYQTTQRLKTSGYNAGLNVLHVISEPAAACMAYKLDDPTELQDVYGCLVYRIGDTSADLSLVKVFKGLFEIEKSKHLSHLGGKAFTARLANYVADEFERKWKIDPRESKRSMAKLYQHADNCKRILSTLESSQIFIESLHEGVDWSQNISRARFENLILSEINLCLEAVTDLIKDTNVKITKVILCGGTTKIPKLQNALSSLLPNVEILDGINPDEVIAYGCAKQATMINQLPDYKFDDIAMEFNRLTTSLYVKYLDSNVCIFPEGCPAIAEIVFELKNSEPLPKLNISLYDIAKPNHVLANFNFKKLRKNTSIYASLENKQVTMSVMK